MEGERGSNVLKPKGCIKTTKGPWAVRRGGHVMRYRFPSEQERLNNKQREKLRRSVRRNIFKGLKTHGNYPLPTHADSNDLRKALCDEAGWHVEDDGTIYRKQERDVGKMPTLVDEDDEEDFCKCGDGNEAEEVDTTLAL